VKKLLLLLITIHSLCLLSACGGGTTTPPPATHLSVTAPAAAAAGTAFNFTVTALDASNNVATTYSGTVHFTSIDSQASLPANSTLTNGTGTFSATLKTAGGQAITATDTVTPSITGTSNSITVSSAASNVLLSVGVPSPPTAGIAFNFTVTALDPATAEVVTSYSGMVHFTSTDTHAALPKDSPLTNGSGSFSATLNSVGSQTIVATDTVKSSITGSSGMITVFGPATHFSVTAPSTATAGTSFNITVTALDAANNVAATYTGTAHFTSTDSHADLPADSPVAGGVAIFPAGLTSGSWTITVTDTVQPSVTGTSGAIDVSAAAAANPVPLINQPLNPDAVIPGGGDFNLTVNGTGFVQGAVVNWNGAGRTTSFVSSSKLTAKILAADIASFNTASVTAVNPAPGGGTSNVLYVEATRPTSSVALSIPSQFNTGLTPIGMITGDFNHDGKLDLVTVNFDGNNITVLLGKGDGTFEPAVNYASGSGPTSVASGDFNGDGILDLAVAIQSSGSGNVSILLGNGDGTFQSPLNFSTGPGSGSIAVGDFNGDGKLDLVTTNRGGNVVAVLLGNGDGSFQAALNYSAGFFPSSVAVGDFNGDGKLDLVVTNATNNISVLLGNGDGTFQPLVGYPTGSDPIAVAVGDFNGDGKLDLVVANESGGGVSVLLGNGDGIFQPAVSFATGAIPISVTVGDFNGDGKPDLLVGRATSNDVSLLLGNGDGTFQSALNYEDGSTGFNASRVAAGDFNDDGRLDIAVANPTSSAISLLLQPELSPGPSAILSPANLTFANQSAGTTSAPQVVTLTNYGVSPVNITDIVTSSNFGQTSDCGSSLAAGASCTISVTFSPTPQGSVTGALSVTDDAPGSPQTVALNGAGTTVQLLPTSIAFVCDTHLPNGCRNTTRTATLTNTGSSVLVISTIGISELNSIASETNNCPTNVSPGQSCTITVKYNGGNGKGHLFVNDNGSGSPQTIFISGEEF
jgi:hypothetical protein